MRRATASLLGVMLSAAALLPFGACLAPTQVTVVVLSRVRCSDLPRGISIAVAATPEASEAIVAGGSASTNTSACSDDGAIGTLVITPGADTAAIVVTAGYGGRETAKCAENGFKDCIVARRRLSFVPHTRLTLPIELSIDCLNVPCDALTTCSKGACVPSRVECSGEGCSELGAGGVDGGPSGDATLDVRDARDATDPPDANPAGLTSDPQCPATGGPMAYRTASGSAVFVPFCIDRTEVTQAAYAAFLPGAGPKPSPGPPECSSKPSSFAPAAMDGNPPCEPGSFTPPTTPNHPVTCVDRCDAKAFCTKMGKSLCTNQQWTAACSGLNDNVYPYGSVFKAGACNDDTRGKAARDVATLPECINSGTTSTVFDLSGNVWERTADGVQGGGFAASMDQLHCKAGASVPTEQFTAEIGFRCCSPPKL